MRRSKAGLSLLELLISLALLAVIAAGLATSLSIGVKAFDRAKNAGDMQTELALRARLRGWLASATPPDSSSNINLDFVGSIHEFHFVTFAPTPHLPDAAALRVTVAVGDTIQMQIDALSDQGVVLESQTRILASGVNNGSISYFDEALDPPNWVTTWNSTARIPSLVQITADPGSTPNWPEMTVRLQLAPPPDS